MIKMNKRVTKLYHIHCDQDVLELAVRKRCFSYTNVDIIYNCVQKFYTILLIYFISV